MAGPGSTQAEERAREGTAKAAEREEVEHVRRSTRCERDEPLAGEHEERRDEGEEEREHDHLRPRGPANDEELRVRLEEREDGLAHRVRPDRDQVHGPQPVRRQRASTRAGEVERPRRSAESSTRSATSKRSRSSDVERLAIVVRVRPGPLGVEEALHHRVARVRELDDHLAVRGFAATSTTSRSGMFREIERWCTSARQSDEVRQPRSAKVARSRFRHPIAGRRIREVETSGRIERLPVSRSAR